MKKTYKIHLIPVLFLVILSSSSFYYPEPYNEIPVLLVLGVYLTIAVIVLTSTARNRKNARKSEDFIPTRNAITSRIDYAASVFLNKSEIILVIYALFIVFGFFLGGMLFPLIRIMLTK